MLQDFMSQRVPFQTFYNSPTLKIYTTSSGYAQWVELNKFVRDNTIIVFHDWSFADQGEEKWKSLTNESLPDNFIFLSNDEYTHQLRKGAGLNDYLVNQNAWINDKIFDIDLNAEKIYNGVINARAKDWKRVHLASKLNDLALIINRWNIDSHRGKNDDSYKTLSYKYLNQNQFSPKSVARIYNQSRFGLILSAREGACYTSLEYLLCGVPVISTRADDTRGTGGREYWYDEYNSIVVNPDAESVFAASQILMDSPRDPHAVRAACLAAMIRQRRHFEFDVLQPIFSKFKITEKAGYSLSDEMFLGTHREKHKLLAEGSLKTASDIIEILNN